MTRVMEDVERAQHSSNQIDTLLAKLDELSNAEKHLTDGITELDDEKEKEVQLLEKRLVRLKRERDRLKMENKRIWDIYSKQ